MIIIDLRSGGVRLRTPRLADLDVLCRADEEDLDARTVRPAGDRREQLCRRIEQNPELHTDGLTFLTVVVDEVAAGDVQVRAPRYAFPPGVCEVGISLVSEARGRGTGTVAIRLVGDWLLENGWSRVQGSTAVDNLAMRRVFQNAGFAAEGIAVGFLPDGAGGRVDAAAYARTRSG